MKARASLGLTAALLAMAGPVSAAPGVLELPEANESGISLIAGWHCNAKVIEIQVDDGPMIKAGSGTLRPDTQGVCGRSDTGFGLTYNYNVHSPGMHAVKAYADGVPFAERRVWTYNYGVEYLRAPLAGCAVRDFPTLGITTGLLWSEAKQNFSITSIQKVPFVPPGGVWQGSARSSIVDTVCPGVDLPTGTDKFDEGSASVVFFSQSGSDVVGVQVTTNHGICNLAGQMGGAPGSTSYMTADLANSDLSCLGSANWSTVSVVANVLGGFWPPSPTESVLSLSIRAHGQTGSSSCAAQWVSFHGAIAPR